jgi:hypothetical protein
VLRTLGQHCSGTGGNLTFLEQARAAPDQVLVRPLLAAVPGVCAGGAAPVRAPVRRERRGGGGGRRGRQEEAVRRTCEGEQYRRRRRSSMSSRSVAGQGAAIKLVRVLQRSSTNWSRPKSTCCPVQMSGFQANSGRHFTGTQGRSMLRVHWLLSVGTWCPGLRVICGVCGYLYSRSCVCASECAKLVLRRACTAMLLTVRTCMDAEVRKPFSTCTHARTHARTGISGRYEVADWLVVGGC